MPMLVLALFGWLLVCLVIVGLCVAARRDDELLHGKAGGRLAGDARDTWARPGQAA